MEVAVISSLYNAQVYFKFVHDLYCCYISSLVVSSLVSVVGRHLLLSPQCVPLPVCTFYFIFRSGISHTHCTVLNHVAYSFRSCGVNLPHLRQSVILPPSILLHSACFYCLFTTRLLHSSCRVHHHSTNILYICTTISHYY